MASVKIICENKPVSLKQLHSFFSLNNASIFPFYGVLCLCKFRSRNYLPFVSTVQPVFFGGVRVDHLCSFLRCPIICRYVLSSCDFCLLSYSFVQHIFCCVFDLFFFVLCTLYCQVFWIVPL